MKRFFCLFGFVMAVSGAYAQVEPVEGMWFDPSASGRGAAIEVQGGVLIVTYFGYGQDNSDRWWQGVGTETFYGSNVYTGDLNALEGGQCVGCPYTPASINPSSSLGTFTINFTGWTTATFSWAGGVDNWVKLDWAFGQQKDYLIGSWLFVSFLSSDATISEENIIFYGTQEINDDEFVVGNRAGYLGTSSYLALASTLDVDGDEWLFILLDSSTSFYLAHLVLMNENKTIGRSWLYRKDENLTGAGLPAAGAKLYGAYELSGALNKSSSPIDLSDLYEQENEAVTQTINSTNLDKLGDVDPVIANHFSEMSDALKQLSNKK